MTVATHLLLAALAAVAQAEGQAQAHGQAQGQEQGGVAVTHSPPPPIVAVTPSPSPRVRVLEALPAPAPPPPLPVIAAAPQERRPLQSLISPDDYPASALANREAGRVEFRLDVGPNGRVHGCTITRSSGSSALDSATCMILRRRARYTPARDSNGMPVGYSVEDGVEWRLPAEDGERG